jgi:hypothetical protein
MLVAVTPGALPLLLDEPQAATATTTAVATAAVPSHLVIRNTSSPPSRVCSALEYHARRRPVKG